MARDVCTTLYHAAHQPVPGYQTLSIVTITSFRKPVKNAWPKHFLRKTIGLVEIAIRIS